MQAGVWERVNTRDEENFIDTVVFARGNENGSEAALLTLESL